MYTIRYTTPEGVDVTVEATSFTLWREDAGFNSEELMDAELAELRGGTHYVKADDRGITSVVEVDVADVIPQQVRQHPEDPSG